MKKKNTVSVRAGEIEFLKVNTEGWEWRDAYHWLLGYSRIHQWGRRSAG